MPKFAANLTLLFTEVPFLDRFAAAREAGFDAVEYLFPYDYPAAELRARLDDHGLTQALFNLPAGDYAGGAKGLVCLPGREAEFRESVDQALEYAEVIGCPKLHAMAGRPADLSDPANTETYVANLRYLGERVAEVGRIACIEPLNPYSVPGYFLSSYAQALDLLDRVDHPNVKLQLDFFHAQLTGGDITNLIRNNIDRIGHVQIASAPDRAEPDHGELYYPYALGVLDDAGYDGWVGAEYVPAGDTVAGLGWLAEYR